MDFYRKQPVISIGVLSLISIFTVLLITSFSILIFVSAQDDMRMSERTAESISEYYVADKTAEEKLGQLHDVMNKGITSNSNLITEIESLGFTVLEKTDYNGIVASYDIPINEKETLHIEIGVPENESNLERLNWRTTYIY